VKGTCRTFTKTSSDISLLVVTLIAVSCISISPVRRRKPVVWSESSRYQRTFATNVLWFLFILEGNTRCISTLGFVTVRVLEEFRERFDTGKKKQTTIKVNCVRWEHKKRNVFGSKSLKDCGTWKLRPKPQNFLALVFSRITFCLISISKLAENVSNKKSNFRFYSFLNIKEVFNSKIQSDSRKL